MDPWMSGQMLRTLAATPPWMVSWPAFSSRQPKNNHLRRRLSLQLNPIPAKPCARTSLGPVSPRGVSSNTVIRGDEGPTTHPGRISKIT